MHRDLAMANKKLLVEAPTGRLRWVFDEGTKVIFEHNRIVAPRMSFNDLNDNNAILIKYNKDIPSDWIKNSYYYFPDEKLLKRV